MRSIRWFVGAVVALGASGAWYSAAPRPRGDVGGARPAFGDAGLRLELNLPAFRLDVFEDGQRIRTYTVAIGMPSSPTPRGMFVIDRLEWNPWWFPPDRNWARGEKPEPPGPANRMGRVKLPFRSLYFIHGTPFEATLGAARSRGCVRLSNADAVELALLLQRAGLPPEQQTDGERAAATMTTRVVTLSRRIPFRILYETAEVRDDSLLLHHDVYDIARSPPSALALAALQRAGLDTSRIGLNKLPRPPRTPGRRAVPLASLAR